MNRPDAIELVWPDHDEKAEQRKREEAELLANDARLRDLASQYYNQQLVAGPLEWYYPFALMGFDDKIGVFQLFAEVNAAIVYEHIDKAGPRFVNGEPRFFSFQYFTVNEALAIKERIIEMFPTSEDIEMIKAWDIGPIVDWEGMLWAQKEGERRAKEQLAGEAADDESIQPAG